MKSGGPWNLRGLRPEAREAARDAARRSGRSVGEWLNDVIRPDDEDYAEPMRAAYHDNEDDGWQDDSRQARRHERSQDDRQEDRQEYSRDRYREYRHDASNDDRDSRGEREPREYGSRRSPRRRRERNPDTDRDIARTREDREAAGGRDDVRRHAPVREEMQEAARTRELRENRARDYAREAALARDEVREAARAREEFGEVHARLDKLSQQLERMARTEAVQLTGSPAPQPGRAPAPPIERTRAARQPLPPSDNVSVDDAVAEIAERQRALYGKTTAAPPLPDVPSPQVAPLSSETPVSARSEPSATPQPLPRAAAVKEPSVDISNLEEQLRYITTRIEGLRPTSDLEKVILAFRTDLTEISRQLTEALPRHAVESLEIEVQALAKRIDHSRDSGTDSSALAGLERGLSEVRDALRGLTPAESLVGFDGAVKALSQKVDLIIGKEDPAALQQLEAAIGALRGIVSHVASNDTLNKVAEDVRSLAAKVDGFAIDAASGQAVSALESRIDTLANALNASAEAGHAVPRELEKLLTGLIEKLEWVQLTHTDHAAMGGLEDRIAQLIKRLDTSDARLGNLEAVERGLADLLVHIDQIRGGNSAPAAGAMGRPAEVDAIERDVAEIKRSDRRTRDSLEAMHGAVEQVVDRLAMIESGIHGSPARPVPANDAPVEAIAERMAELAPASEPALFATPEPAPAPAPVFESEAVPEPALGLAATLASFSEPMSMSTLATATPASTDSDPRRTATPRTPIDPNLPPDHPLEPGSGTGPRTMPSAADRIAASEAAVGYAKAPADSEPVEKPNFIAAARRAAQAAAASPPERQTRAGRVAIEPAKGEKPSRTRKLIVAVAALLIVVGGARIALHMFQGNDVADTPPPPEQASQPEVLPDANSGKEPPQSGPLVLPVPGAPAPENAPIPAPSDSHGAAPGAPAPGVAAPGAPAPGAPANAKPDASPAAPGRQSALPDSLDITGALPRRAPSPAQPAATADATPARTSAPGIVIEKLPATIGGPTLRAAAMAGDAAAEFEVATRFAEGRGVTPSNEQALHWLDSAAKQGLAPAQFRLGGFYEKGIGVKKDLAAARDLYMAAATKGNGKAMHNLAVLYAEGVNGPADYRSAAHWFRKAANDGITDSQYNLAILYARGVGVEQNYAESYKWFVLAANAGDNEAAKKRDEIVSHLDPQSLAAAQAAVAKWTAEPQPDDAVNVKTPPSGWDPAPQAAKPKPRAVGVKPVALDAKPN